VRRRREGFALLHRTELYNGKVIVESSLCLVCTGRIIEANKSHVSRTRTHYITHSHKKEEEKSY
jgi:hypothetical protein